jgi:hypothetical protein
MMLYGGRCLMARRLLLSFEGETARCTRVKHFTGELDARSN